jgi:predicted Ser/Thr protein kinase
VVASPPQSGHVPRYWPSARHFTEVIQCPSVCFASPVLQNTMPAVDRLGMPIVTSGQFAYVYKLKSTNGHGDYAVRCFRGYLGDRDQRYRAIQDHVQSLPVLCLSDFRYAPEGILVGGQRYPILFMKWLEGPTLDLYVGEMLHRRDVLLHLSQEWLRVVSALEASGVAHGDLQHGNVIVEHGQLRLIDHDGIYVPAMDGWPASEVGHQHYQHPQRTAQHFDQHLDNFSALVIYLSLLSLAERPELWQEYHDENLLFTKADFHDPSTSALFGKIREIGPEHNRLADILANAASGQPNSAPRLLELVQAPSRLPAWMTAPTDLETETKTREVARSEAPADMRTARWSPWQEKTRDRPLPSTPGSPTVQSVFSASTPASVPIKRDPAKVVTNTFSYAWEFYRQYFFWWYWGAYVLFQFSGLGFTVGFMVATATMILFAYVWGVYKATELSRNARLGQSILPSSLPPVPQVPTPRRSPLSYQTVTHVYPLPSAPAKPPQPIVGNRVLGIYHVETCDWVEQISAPSMVTFASPAEALSHGYKACRICFPNSLSP